MLALHRPDVSCPARPRQARALPFLLLLVAVATLPGTALAVGELTYEQVQQQIALRGASWEASDHFVSTLTPEQRANLTGFVPPPDWERTLKEHERVLPVPKDLPSNFDWRNTGMITSVKNQGECGSCWAFAATAELESRILIGYGQNLDLSEQQTISCNGYGAGCGGGWAAAAYSVWSSYGAVHENCFHYEGMDGLPCVQTSHPPLGRVTTWHSVPNDVNQIKTALLIGPVCTGISTGGGLEYYSGGCYDAYSGGYTDHLVLIVGWDDRQCDGVGAWIIKNSWGTDFGMAGYAYVKYGAALIGSGCTQVSYTPPPTTFTLLNPGPVDTLVADQPYTLQWTTSGASAPLVDIRFSLDDYCFELPVATNLPNTGSYVWTVPNLGTNTGRLIVHASTGTLNGYDFADDKIRILGHKTRYVAASGSATPPYETPATAAHTIAAAVAACSGRDTVLVAGGDYFETVTISSTIRLVGGWSANFATRDPALYPSLWRGTSSALRFLAGAGSFGAVDGFTFHECVGGTYSSPVSGQHGGAIYCLGGSPAITNCRFLDGQAAGGTAFGLGGAILVSGGSPLIADCVFERNLATRGGALALVDATPTLRDNLFLANACTDSTDENRGGAVWISGGSVTMLRDEIADGGGAGKGGGIALDGGALAAADLVLRNNRARLDGGGLRAAGGTLELRRALLEGNSAGVNGGGLQGEGCTLDVANAVLRANRAANMGGGGLVLSAVGGEVANSLFASNHAASYGGLLLMATGELHFRNNLVVGNQGTGFACLGSLVQADYNLSWGNTGANFGAAMGPHDLSLDPLLVDLAGGDWALGLHSPCLDAGEPGPACVDPDGGCADLGPYGGPDASPVAPPRVLALQAVGVGLPSPGEPIYWELMWEASPAPDLARYVVYRDTAAVFVPGPEKVFAEVLAPATSCPVGTTAGTYRVVAVDADGHVGGYSEPVTISDLVGVGETPPARFGIAGVAPNPFNPTTRIVYDLLADGPATLRIHDARGRLVRDLGLGTGRAGRHEAVWDGRDGRGRALPSGLYVARLEAAGQVATVKLVLAR